MIIFQQVIHTIKMKKYAQMNLNTLGSFDPSMVAAASPVVIKRHRNARKASFSDPEEFSKMTNILSKLETLKV
jgi:hypothetical protein